MFRDLAGCSGMFHVPSFIYVAVFRTTLHGIETNSRETLITPSRENFVSELIKVQCTFIHILKGSRANHPLYYKSVQPHRLQYILVASKHARCVAIFVYHC